MTGTNGGGLLDHPPAKMALADRGTSFWLRDLMASAALRDPVDVLADLEAARALVGSYFDALTSGARYDIRPNQMPGGA
ncbi:MAG: hypothetical protein RLZZ366_2533 [Pseudomonadota bacterium]|jgi:hypothetical protein